MTDINQAAPATPAQILVATPQPDDAGAETNDRYDWQAALATVHILSAYFDLLGGGQVVPNDAALELICEHHEDWAITDGHDAEIVSAKHHETAFGAYTTLRKLMDEGGLHHLFERWIALQRSPRCRLVTTPGLSGDARRLEAACAHFSDQPAETVEVGEWQELLDDLAKVISEFRLKKLKGADPEATPESVPTESVGTIVAFLRILRIDHGQPRREHLPYMAGNAFAMPVAAALGRPDAADAIWQALLQVVRERMRAAGPTLRAALPTVLGAKDEDGFEARSLTLNEVQVIVTVALANPAGYRPLPRRLKTSKVAVKMSVGGCSQITRSNAPKASACNTSATGGRTRPGQAERRRGNAWSTFFNGLWTMRPSSYATAARDGALPCGVPFSAGSSRLRLPPEHKGSTRTSCSEESLTWPIIARFGSRRTSMPTNSRVVSLRM